MKKKYYVFFVIIQSVLCMQEEHSDRTAQYQKPSYRVHCADGTITLSEHEWNLLVESSNVIQYALDFHDNNDQELKLVSIELSPFKDILRLLTTEERCNNDYNLHRMHKLLLGASYLNIDPQKTINSISHLKKLLNSSNITDPIAKEVLLSDYALENASILNDPVPIIPCIRTIKDNTKTTLVHEQWNQYHIKLTSNSLGITIHDPLFETPIKKLKGHTEAINMLCICGNSTLASASDDRTIKLWDLNSGQCINTLKGHDSRVSILAMCNDNILFSRSNNSIKLWDLTSCKCIKTFNFCGRSLDKLSIGPNNVLAFLSTTHSIGLCDLNSDQYLKELKGHKDRISVFVIGGNNILASGDHDSIIKLWDISTGKCIATLTGHTNSIDRLLIYHISHSQIILISGSKDKTIKLWNINSRQCITTLDGFNRKAPLVDRIFFPEGNIPTHIKLQDMQEQEYFHFTKLNVQEDILIGGSANTIKFWDISALHPKKYTPMQNAFMRTILKYKELKKMIPESLSNDENWQDTYNSLPLPIKKECAKILESLVSSKQEFCTLS